MTEAELNSDEALNSAHDHLEGALEKCEVCFGARGVAVRSVFADELTVVDDGRTEKIVPKRQPEGIGAFLISPGRKGRIVHAGSGPSSLIVYVPATASEYFQLPSCDPAEVRNAP